MIIPNYDQTMEKLITMCCRLSREVWITYTTSTKGNFRSKNHFYYENLQQFFSD